MEPPRVPVPRTANPSEQRSASSPERNDAGSGHESSDASRRSEPGSAKRSRLKDDTIPLQDIKDMVNRIHQRYEKVKKDKKKESARKTQQKKQKAKDAKEVKEKLDDLREGASAILAACETEVAEVRRSKFTARLDAMLGSYLKREMALLEEILGKILVPKPDEAAVASASLQLIKLQTDIGGDATLEKWPVLKLLHTHRLGYIKTAMQV